MKPDDMRHDPHLPTLNPVGAGRVGQTLARLWHTQGVFAIQHVRTNSMATAQAACTVIVFHCSGSHDSGLLAPLAALGWRVASAHCLLSFASAPLALQQFPGTPCALEGNANACDDLRPAFTTIGGRCFDIASSDKQVQWCRSGTHRPAQPMEP